ncbi:helix-turn-helix domain-containing protein [Bacillus sp. JJ1566]|uniref:PucR family transcriptional regulator n=1 Tax=Bacillus sp. JJ1566 TaxID=3122961 RepID=UPI002FFDFA84
MRQPLGEILTMTDIDQITDKISAFLKKPVVIESDQFSLLSYSSYYIDQFDQANQQTIFTKRWTPSILEKFMDEGIVEQLKSIPEPFRVKRLKSIGLNQRVVVSAKFKDRIFGYIWVQEIDNLLSDHELEFLHEVSFHIGKLIYQKSELKHKYDEEIDQFYKNVIENTYQTENQIKWEAADRKVILPEAFLMIVFTVAQYDKNVFDELREKVRLFANAINEPTHLLTDQLNIVVIIGSTSSDPRPLSESANELTNTVLSQFRSQTVFAGIGNLYTSILQLSKSYAEAQEVIAAAKFIGSPTQQVYEFKKLGIFRYLDTIYRQQSETNYENADIQILQKKDLESQTNLLETLEIYLLNNGRLKPTADQLFIHINTLKYRLNQITDLTEIDFDDFNMRCQLYIDLQLKKLTGSAQALSKER